MDTITISTSSKTYPIYLGANIIPEISEFLSTQWPKLSQIVVITDTNVASLHLQSLLKVIETQWSVHTFTMLAGEQSKSFETFYSCHTALLEAGVDRQTVVIAFGGGVVGDLAGFVAATYMRGVPFIQVPTTLLAHDSAVGGKVAINHPLGKNMIGAFYQPQAIFYDIALLKTLDECELRSGFAEVIKHAMIHDVDLYEWLKNNILSLDDLSDNRIHYAIKAGISVKAEIVGQDETEKGIRAYLNFGHTLGHALESELGYGTITHGDAIAIGMLYAIAVSEHVYGTDLHLENITSWFEGYGFPTTIPSEIKFSSLLHRMKKDKKSAKDGIRMVLMKSIGTVVVEKIDEKVLEEVYYNWITSQQ
ncbi:3-dehydroquinate synthase [Bacillus sp. HMF5848]|uniref:3-dehydroquinate synthase n=1 Tax=Bacillus sp. HMF5848 TaxID=2495421 RepID=UPI000F7BB1F1|nr:3-dehydroquinate synthase [Bacillus sp. HMF5848]RSK27430.1 3-dehydroquinate synthase [Bacillus sp. HMF5848]